MRNIRQKLIAFSRENSFGEDTREMRCDSEVLEIKKAETVITEKEQELKRRLNQKIKDPNTFSLVNWIEL